MKVILASLRHADELQDFFLDEAQKLKLMKENFQSSKAKTKLKLMKEKTGSSRTSNLICAAGGREYFGSNVGDWFGLILGFPAWERRERQSMKILPPGNLQS